MLRGLSFSAALAALAVPIALSAPVLADPGGTPEGDPAGQALHRQEQKAGPRPPVVSRRAERVRTDDQEPLAVSIDQLTPSTVPGQGMVRVSGFVTNNDTQT